MGIIKTEKAHPATEKPPADPITNYYATEAVHVYNKAGESIGSAYVSEGLTWVFVTELWDIDQDHEIAYWLSIKEEVFWDKATYENADE